MPNGWASDKNYVISGGQVVPASQTDYVVSYPMRVSAGGALNSLWFIQVAAVTGTVTAKLQTGFNDVWVDSKTVDISATGLAVIKLLATDSGDAAFLPLRSMCRIVVTTAGGEAIAISGVYSLVEQ